MLTILPKFKDDSMNNSSSDDDFESDESFTLPEAKIFHTANVMENLIGAMNKIQDVFNTLKIQNSIKLPQIVMLGPQVGLK